MSTQDDLPLGLLKANLELQLRIAKLLREHGQRWLELSMRVGQEGVDECQSELESLLKAGNWQHLATLSGEAFWHRLQQCLADHQSAAQLTVEAQAELAQGIQQALQQWRQTAPTNTAGATQPAGLPFTDFIKNWSAVWTAPAATQPARAARKEASHAG